MDVSTSVPRTAAAPRTASTRAGKRRRELIHSMIQMPAKDRPKRSQYCSRKTSNNQKCGGSPRQSVGVPCHIPADAITSTANKNGIRSSGTLNGTLLLPPGIRDLVVDRHAHSVGCEEVERLRQRSTAAVIHCLHRQAETHGLRRLLHSPVKVLRCRPIGSHLRPAGRQYSPALVAHAEHMRELVFRVVVRTVDVHHSRAWSTGQPIGYALLFDVGAKERAVRHRHWAVLHRDYK